MAADSATQIVPREGCLLGVPGPSCRQGDGSVVSLVKMMENGILATLCHAELYSIWHSLVSTEVKWLLGKGHLGGSLCCAEPGLRWGPSLEIFGDELAKSLYHVGLDQNGSAMGFECVKTQTYILVWKETLICQALCQLCLLLLGFISLKKVYQK